MYNPQTIAIIGLLITVVLGFLSTMNLLKSNKVLLVLFVLTAIMAIYGYTIKDQVPVLMGINPSNTFYGPFILISCFIILRFIYKTIYKDEPTYDTGWNNDYKDGQFKRNAMDVIVHLIPIFSGVLLPIILDLN